MHLERIGDLTALHAVPSTRRHAPSLVFVHGLWAAGWIFEDWANLAAERGWDAWAVHLRGREGSRPVADLGKVRIRDFARDLDDVLEAVGPAALVGYSMGGLVVQTRFRDDRVLAAVLLCSVPPRGIVALTAPVARAALGYLPALALGRPMLPTRRQADRMLMNRLRPDERDRWFPRFVADSGAAAREMAFGTVGVAPVGRRLPVLVAGATDDLISPPSIQPKLARRYRGARLTFEGHGHLVAIEDGWRDAATRVLEWAEAVTVGPTTAG